MVYKWCKKPREMPQTHPIREMSVTQNESYCPKLLEFQQPCDDIWNVNRCQAVIVSFYEDIYSFRGDFSPCTSSCTLLWHRTDVSSWNSKKRGNQVDKMDATAKDKLTSTLRSKGHGGVSQSSQNDARSEMDKWWLGMTCSCKCCEEVIPCGGFTWDFWAGRQMGLGEGRLFMIKE